jgi:DNA-binding transcriptional regulator GbsR (MarR family)
MSTTPARWQTNFIERVSSVGEFTGLPPSYLRILAWLLVCDPAHQSVDELRETLTLSSGAISAATTSLLRMGLVERITIPGERRAYYRFPAGGWDRVLRDRLEAITRVRVLVDDALAHAPQADDRLKQMHDIYLYFEEAVGELVTDVPTPTAHRRRPAR